MARLINVETSAPTPNNEHFKIGQTLHRLWHEYPCGNRREFLPDFSRHIAVLVALA